MFVQFSLGSAAGLEIVGPSNAIYVDVAGNNATGTRGNAARPFLTLAAALAVAQSGDEILISPGTFSSLAATVTLPALANLIIRGSGESAGDTVLTANADVDVITLNPANRSLLIENLRITALGTGRGVVGTGGAGIAGAFLNSGLKLEHVDITTKDGATDALAITEANEIILFDVQAAASSSSFLTCSNIRLRGESTLGAVQQTFNNADANKPAAAQSVGLHLRAGATIGAWTGTGEPLITADPGSTIASMTGATLAVSGGLAPVFQVHGSVGNCTFTGGATTLPDGAVTPTVVNFSGAVLTGNAYTFSDAADVTNQAINFTGVRTSAAVTLTSGLRCKMDERGSQFAVQPTYTSAGATLGTHLPSKLIVLGTAAIADTTVNFGFTADNTNYMAFGLETAAAGTPVTQGAKNATNTHIAIGGAPAGTIDVCIMWI